jgi:hypothetical protein
MTINSPIDLVLGADEPPETNRIRGEGEEVIKIPEA